MQTSRFMQPSCVQKSVRWLGRFTITAWSIWELAHIDQALHYNPRQFLL